MSAVAEDAGPTLTTLRGQEAHRVLIAWVLSARPAPDPMYVRQLVEYVTELENDNRRLREGGIK